MKVLGLIEQDLDLVSKEYVDKKSKEIKTAGYITKDTADKAYQAKGEYATKEYVDGKLKEAGEEQRDFIEKEVIYGTWHIDKVHYKGTFSDFVRLLIPLNDFYRASFSPGERLLAEQREYIVKISKVFFDKNGKSMVEEVPDDLTPGAMEFKFKNIYEFYISDFARGVIQDFILALSGCVLEESNKSIAARAFSGDIRVLKNIE